MRRLLEKKWMRASESVDYDDVFNDDFFINTRRHTMANIHALNGEVCGPNKGV